jgi:hypothetical protein
VIGNAFSPISDVTSAVIGNGDNNRKGGGGGDARGMGQKLPP